MALRPSVVSGLVHKLRHGGRILNGRVAVVTSVSLGLVIGVGVLLAYGVMQLDNANLALAEYERENDVLGVFRAIEAGADPNGRRPTRSTQLLSKIMSHVLRSSAERYTPSPLSTLLDPCGVSNAKLSGMSDIIYPPENLAILRCLLSAGADVNFPSCSAGTPLITAIVTEKYKTASLLLDYHADPSSIRPETGYSALMLAVIQNQPGLIDKLIKCGADVNYTSTCGMSAWSVGLARRAPQGLQLTLRESRRGHWNRVSIPTWKPTCAAR